MNIIEGKTIFFTGATSGLGKFAALNFAAHGAIVIAAIRDESKGQKLLNELDKNYPKAKGTIELLECDLSSIKSIQTACKALKNKYLSIDIIINNAGTWNFSFNETEDGIENTLQVNLLAPLFITIQLLDLLKKAPNAKVINTASGLHQGNIDFSDIEYRNKFSGFKSYRQSKLGVILLTRLYQKKYGEHGIHFYSQHPGLVSTELVRGGGWFSKGFFKLFGKSPESGAKSLIYLAKTPHDKLIGGEYYKNEKASKTDTKASYSLELAEKLENVCLHYLGKHLDIQK